MSQWAELSLQGSVPSAGRMFLTPKCPSPVVHAVSGWGYLAGAAETGLLPIQSIEGAAHSLQL